MYSIKDAAQALGLHPKTLRRWEETGKFTPLRTLGNQRRFTDKDINLLTKLKAGEPLPRPAVKQLTLDQAAAKLNVSSATIQRWTKAGKLKISVNDQLEPGYSEVELNRLLKPPTVLQGPTLQVPPASEPVSLPTRSNLAGKYLPYAGIAGFIGVLAITGYLIFKQEPPLASPQVQENQTPVVDIALPRTAQFLDGRITLGLATGDLFYADSTGNLYVKNSALIDQGVFTHGLQLLPTSQPQEGQIGQLYVDQGSGNLKYFDGLDWIDLNKTTALTASGSGNLTTIYNQQDLDLTLGDLNASASATSLRVTLAGGQSMIKVLGGAGQAILTLNDDALYPVIISQPTQILGNLLAPKFIDQDQSGYFLDPSNTDLSLAVAGDATISSTLKFSKNGEYISNSIDNYLIFSGGIGIGGSTSYGFNPEQKLNAKGANIENELTVAGKVGLGTDANSSYRLKVSGDVYVDGNITANGTITPTPDYVFEDKYTLLSPLQLKEFITTQKHLPGVPSAAEIQQNGLNLPQMLLALLEKTEENTLYILDLYDRSNRIISPTVETEILTTNMISPLSDGQIIISGNASVSGTLYASQIESSTIDRLREKISELAQKEVSTPGMEEMATASAILEALPPATDSGHLALTSLESDAAFFKDYLAVLGQTTLTDVKINSSLTVNTITSLDNQLFIQPSGLGGINFLAGLMTLDQSGQVTINGNLTVAGAISASQINPLPNQELTINIASGSALSIYSQISPLATFSGKTVSLANLKLEASGTATVSAGANNLLINTDRLSNQSQVIVTFTSDYTPATKYWVKKDPAADEFTIFTNYPVNNDTTLDWLIIN
ncbi:MAG: MerR family transcriptional regulator [Candidatus Beckwithbacteria bacterium]|nr:MerR family transcriptional regulator [Candidatus Beckwithbacteria bacterium]